MFVIDAPYADVVGLGDSGRHRSDLVRAIVGFFVVFLPAFVVGEADPGRPERWLFRTVNHLPGTLTAPLVGVMQAGSLAAVAVVGTFALAVHRRSLAQAFLASGAVAWASAKALGFVVRRQPPDEVIDQIIVRGHLVKTTVFPSTHAAVVAALAIAAMPYIGRFGRRASAAVVVFVGFSRLFVGAQFPVDVVAGWGVGVVVASVVHLIRGSPHRRPSEVFIRSIVRKVGFEPSAVAIVPDRSVPTYRVDTSSSPVIVQVFGHDEEVGWLYRLWRLVAYREIGDQLPFRSANERARQYITVSLLAQRANVRSGRFIDLVDARADRTAVVTTAPTDECLNRLPQAQITDVVLRSIWTELASLHAAGVVHRGLKLSNLAIESDGRVFFDDLTMSEPSRGFDLRANDIATLLVSLGALTTAERSTATAVEIIGSETIGAVIGLVQPLSIERDVRRSPNVDQELFGALRSEISRRTGATEPKATPAAQVAARNLAVVIVGAIAVNLLLSQFGSLHQTLTLVRSPRWPWLAVVAAASLLTYVMATASALGSTALPLRPGRTFLVQIAAAFTNRLSPAGLGGMATNIRYLERSGANRASAAGAVALNTIAGFTVHVAALLAVAPSLGGVTRRIGDLPDHWSLLGVAASALAIVGIAVAVRFVPRVLRIAGDVVGSVRDVLAHPGRALLLFGGSLGVTLAYAGALAGSLHAFGAHPLTVDVLVVFLVASAVGAASPTPGGLGALEAALIAGFTHIGVPASPAVAGVLCYRLVTYWAPVIPGYFSFRFLRRHAVL